MKLVAPCVGVIFALIALALVTWQPSTSASVHDAGQSESRSISTAGGAISDDASQSVCPGDLNGDGLVNVSDLLAVIGGWGPCPIIKPCLTSAPARSGASMPTITHAYNIAAGPGSTQLLADDVNIAPGDVILLALHTRSATGIPVLSATWQPDGASPQPLLFVTNAIATDLGMATSFHYLKKPAAGQGAVVVQLESAPSSYSAMSVLVINGGNRNAPIDAVAVALQANPGDDLGFVGLNSTIPEGLAIHACSTDVAGTMSSSSNWSIACDLPLAQGEAAGNLFVHHKPLIGTGGILGSVANSNPQVSFWNVGVVVAAASTQKLTADEAPLYCASDMQFWHDLLAVQPQSGLVNLAAIGDSRSTYHSSGAGIVSDMARGAYMSQKWGGSFATRIMFGTEYYGIPDSTAMFPITNSGCAWLSGFRRGDGVVTDLGTSFVPGENLYSLLMTASSNPSHALFNHNDSYPFLFLFHHQLGVGPSGMAEGNPALSYCPLDQQLLVDVWCFSKPGSGQLNVKVEAAQDVRYSANVLAELNGPAGENTSLPLNSQAFPPTVHLQTFGPYTVFTNPNDRYFFVRLKGTNSSGTRFLAIQIRSEQARGIASTLLGYPSQTSAWHSAFINGFPALAGVGFDAVEIMFGAHDINTGNKTATQYAAAVESLVGAIRQHAPGMPIILRADWRMYNITDPLKLDRHSEYAGALLELATELSAQGPVLFKNTLGILNQQLNFEADHGQYFPAQDYVHLTVPGAEAVEQADWDTFYDQFAEADGACADVNGDGTVNVTDLLAVLAAWGTCPN